MFNKLKVFLQKLWLKFKSWCSKEQPIIESDTKKTEEYIAAEYAKLKPVVEADLKKASDAIAAEYKKIEPVIVSDIKKVKNSIKKKV